MHNARCVRRRNITTWNIACCERRCNITTWNTACCGKNKKILRAVRDVVILRRGINDGEILRRPSNFNFIKLVIQKFNSDCHLLPEMAYKLIYYMMRRSQ